MAKDVFGDIHGHADALEHLLEQLGYVNTMGAWRKSGHQALFVGDLIDRGPKQVETVDIVRRMVDAGSAQIAMGNHEYNAIAYATRNPESRTGGHFRPRTPQNTRHHSAYLDAVGTDSALHREHIEWFKTIPLWLDLRELRIVHACWHPQQMELLGPHVDADARLTEPGLLATLKRGSPEYKAAEIVLKGLEIPLPEGCSFFDKDGTERFRTRVRWWDGEAVTYAEAAIAEETSTPLPDLPIPEDARLALEAVPTLFGHYWADGEPLISSPTHACIDFSIGKGGYLTAYSWDGEPTLDPSKLTWVSGARADLAPAL